MNPANITTFFEQINAKYNASENDFRTLVRDFLIQLKEFSVIQGELYQAEKEQKKLEEQQVFGSGRWLWWILGWIWKKEEYSWNVGSQLSRWWIILIILSFRLIPFVVFIVFVFVYSHESFLVLMLFQNSIEISLSFLTQCDFPSIYKLDHAILFWGWIFIALFTTIGLFLNDSQKTTKSSFIELKWCVISPSNHIQNRIPPFHFIGPFIQSNRFWLTLFL